jgi:opacity protein-like surface antigen
MGTMLGNVRAMGAATLLTLAVAAPTSAADAALVVRSGTIQIVMKLTVDPAIPNGTSVYVFASATTYDSAHQNYSSAELTGATVQNGTITATLPIRYDWTLDSTDTVVVGITVSGSNGTYSADTEFGQSFAVPANATTTTLTFQNAL